MASITGSRVGTYITSRSWAAAGVKETKVTKITVKKVFKVLILMVLKLLINLTAGATGIKQPEAKDFS